MTDRSFLISIRFTRVADGGRPSYLYRDRDGALFIRREWVSGSEHRWFVYHEDDAETPVGDASGYRTLRAVRDTIAAVEMDRVNGYDIGWV